MPDTFPQKPTLKLWREVFGIQSESMIGSDKESRRFLVQFDSPIIDPSIDIYGSQKCPVFFDFHPKNQKLICIGRRAVQNVEVPNVFELVVQYADKWAPEADTQPQVSGGKFKWITNPLERPAEILWDTYQTKEPMEMAYDSQDKPKVPVETTAGEPLILEESISRRVLRVSKCVQRVNPLFATELDFINKEDVKIGQNGGVLFKKETLWMTNIKVQGPEFEQGKIYYILSFDLYHNPLTWVRKVRNMGFHEREVYRGKDGKLYSKLVRIKLDKDEYPTVPVPILSRPLIEANILPGLTNVTLTERQKNIIIGKAVRLPATPKWVVASPEIAGYQGLPKDFWKHNMLEFRTRKRLKFTGNIPFK